MFLICLFTLCAFSQVSAVKILFCPAPSKGHYNPYMSIVKQLLKFNQENGQTYEIHVSLFRLEKVGLAPDWIQQDFKDYDYQLIDQASNQPKLANKTLFFYKYGEFKGDFLKSTILEKIETLASLSVESFNFYMERFKNYPEEKPDIFVMDALDIHYSYFDIFQQLNVKFNNSIRMITLSTTLSDVSEGMNRDEYSLVHSTSFSELLWGTVTDHVLGQFSILHEHFQWFKMRVWKYSVFSIVTNMIVTYFIMPFVTVIGHLFAIIKIRPNYRKDLIESPLSMFRIYNQVSNQYPTMLMSAPGLLETVRMKPYMKFFDLGFPITTNVKNQAVGNVELAKWMDSLSERNQKLIFISTGSQFKLNIQTNRNILRGLSILLNENEDLHVLIRIEQEQQEILQSELNSNLLNFSNYSKRDWVDRIKLSTEFLPQHFILQHQATRLFVTHCGYNSVSEGLFYGKPMIGIPISADQFLVCNRMQDQEFGDWIYSKWITPHNFYQILEKTLKNPEIQTRVLWASNFLQDFSKTSSEKIHQALDFTMKYFSSGNYRGFDRDYGLALPWEYSKVILFTTFIQIVFVCWLIWYMLKSCCKCCCCFSKQSSTKLKLKNE